MTQSAVLRKQGAENQTALISEYRSIRDYVEAMDNTGESIRSTTWGGLAKKSERWHRDRNIRAYAKSFQDILNRYNGRYRRWTSSTEEIVVGEFTLKPLTSDLELLSETVKMSHCVAAYGDRCVSDNSRIFSVYQGDQHIGTAEIYRQGTSPWKSIQARGKHNRSLDPGVHSAMEAAAKMYDAAWRAQPKDTRSFVEYIKYEERDALAA